MPNNIWYYFVTSVDQFCDLKIDKILEYTQINILLTISHKNAHKFIAENKICEDNKIDVCML